MSGSTALATRKGRTGVDRTKSFLVRLDNKSRMNREIHVRIREGVGVRLHLRYSTTPISRATRMPQTPLDIPACHADNLRSLAEHTNM